MPGGCRTDDLRKLDRRELIVGQPLPGALCDHAGRVLVHKGTVLDQAELERLRTRAPDGIFGWPDWGASEPPQRNRAPNPAEDVAAGIPPGRSDRSETDRSETGPIQVVEALNRRHGPSRAKRARGHERRAWRTRITFEIEDAGGEGVRRRTVDVMTSDLSAGGLAFLFDHYVHPGTKLRARFDALPNKPHLHGVVRNCTHLSGVKHRVGVQFVDAQHK